MKPLPHNYHVTWVTPGGVALCAYIAPCSWMYQHGLQIEVNLGNKPRDFTGLSLHCAKKLPYAQYTKADFAATIAGCEAFLVLCACGAPAWRHPSTNRDGHCEPCFMRNLKAEFAKESKRAAARERKRDMKLYQKGYKFKVLAWVHPSAGGDDYQLVLHFRSEPSNAEIVTMLKRRRSRVLTDFSIKSMIEVLFAPETVSPETVQ